MMGAILFYQVKMMINPIPVIISDRCKNKPKSKPKHYNGQRNIKTIKRSNKVIEALDLPTIINLNPRSVYNKVDELHRQLPTF